MSNLTHLNAKGEAHMVDVTEKQVTQREARARAEVRMAPDTLALLLEGKHSKGDVLAVARLAGIQAAKKTADLIPLCHSLNLTSVKLMLEPSADGSGVSIESVCKLAGRTGVEMEALTAVSIAALTVYDMCKAVDRGMEITQIALLEKKGGRSGHWQSGAGKD